MPRALRPPSRRRSRTKPRGHLGPTSWAFSQTLDAELGLLYVAIETPGPNDYWGGDRNGDGLYGNCLVALDAETGKLKWYFQAVHHDLWDYDLPSPPALLDVTVNGRVVGDEARDERTRRSHHVSGKERQAVRRDHGRRRKRA